MNNSVYCLSINLGEVFLRPEFDTLTPLLKKKSVLKYIQYSCINIITVFNKSAVKLLLIICKIELKKYKYKSISNHEFDTLM